MKHFVSFLDIKAEEIKTIFDLTDDIKAGKIKQLLKGKTGVLFFPDSSIRTRLSFEKGIKDLGGDTILFPPSTLDKRESLEDVIKYIENWADYVIVRHKDIEKIKALAVNSTIPIINAMTSDNHPCEIISDLYGISCMNSDFKRLTYTFVGERANISTSWINASKCLNFKLNHVCTSGQAMTENDERYTFYTVLDQVLRSTDVVLTDPLSKEMRNDDYYKHYQITKSRMDLAKDGAVLNPCPPFFRGEEVSRDAIESSYFVGHHFKKNLIYVQQAIILFCLGLA